MQEDNLTEDAERYRLQLYRNKAAAFLANLALPDSKQPMLEALTTLLADSAKETYEKGRASVTARLDRIDREAFERGKQAAELQPVPTPPPAGKAELTLKEERALWGIVHAWHEAGSAELSLANCRELENFVASLRAEAVAKVEREHDEARAELERIKKELAEQQTREGEWQCAVSNKIDALEKQLRQALESHADELAQVEREAFQRGLEQRDTVAASEAKTALDKWRKWAVEVCYVYGLSAPTEPDLARGIIANAVRCGTLPKPYTQPLTDAQVDELAQVALEAHDGLQEVLREDWRLSGEGWCAFWRNVIRALAPRIARIQLRELSEEEISKASAVIRVGQVNAGHLAMAGASALELMGGPFYRISGTREFANRILELAQTEAPGKPAAVEGQL